MRRPLNLEDRPMKPRWNPPQIPASEGQIDIPDLPAAAHPQTQPTALDQCLVENGFLLGAHSIRVHLQLADRLRACGFIVRWVERDGIHPVWHLRLFAGTAMDADNYKAVRKQVRRALREVGLWVNWDGVSVSISGKLIIAAFVHEAGFPGRVSFSCKGKAVKPGAPRNIRPGQR